MQSGQRKSTFWWYAVLAATSFDADQTGGGCTARHAARKEILGIYEKSIGERKTPRMKISFLYFELPEEEKQIRQIVEQIKFLIPPWIRLLVLSRYCSESNEDAAASVNNDYPYRSAEIRIYDRFFHTPLEVRRRYIIHEFLHMRHAEVADWTMINLLGLAKEKAPDAHTYLEKEYRERAEGYTQDMAYILDELVAKDNLTGILR